MPRVSIGPSSQTSGSNFKFEEGNGQIVNCVAAIDEIPGYTPRAGFMVSIQRYDANWKPTSEEPVNEFLGAGNIETKTGEPLWHIGQADSSDDMDPELEIGGKKDLGAEVGTEGNCLINAHGKGPDRRSKLSIFVASLTEHGFPEAFLNGYAPNLIGLRATFSQKMLPKAAGSTAKEDPTCLIVGAGGKEAGGKIVRMSDAVETAKGGHAPAPAAQATKPGPRPVAAAPKPTQTTAAAPKTNGAAHPPAEVNEATQVPAGEDAERLEGIALTVLSQVAEKNAGQTFDQKKLGARTVPLLVKLAPPSEHRQIQAFIKNPAWLAEKAEMFGWAVTATGDLQFPAETA